MSLDTLEKLIVQWGKDKGILPSPDPLAQFGKTLEEISELHEALEDKDVDEVRDAIGDIFVTLVMQVQAWPEINGMSDCVSQAYNVISKRTGKMVNGVFVKDD